MPFPSSWRSTELPGMPPIREEGFPGRRLLLLFISFSSCNSAVLRWHVLDAGVKGKPVCGGGCWGGTVYVAHRMIAQTWDHNSKLHLTVAFSSAKLGGGGIVAIGRLKICFSERSRI